MLLNGKCHCGAIQFTLDWPGDSPDIPARACTCSFCSKHGGVWTSHPGAKLTVVVNVPNIVSEYAFGTETAVFHICTRCGVVPIVTSDIADHRYAVVNVNALDNIDPSRLQRGTSNLGDEALQSRLDRRRKFWIADVRIS
jgi:hypothetical protein